ncbi:adenylate/guanylate cyclase catalytic domain protein [Leptospira fainei serovar Hurstbridge str. BUT 6]|uniref:Adenylate/guanylate cyclase catalytic domain protein n=1 Tax=Leptospira fainei serovar Hurstbridge str. BUT 6 TaxID=1193011 RepID=S3UZZ6_9LEPT|nr:adenylate/guanylate cyclase domain-containing protein [Leptospira fainei]EPG74803.1 adenylate/guanylate cyclase catalytic domain protein [Leptospira fainei serovar Hurstbridge str. BUT 6]
MAPKIFDTFSDTLESEILQSERIRSKILLLIFLTTMTIWTSLAIFVREKFNESIGLSFPFEIVIGILLFGNIYEFGVLKLLNYWATLGKPLPLFPRFGNAFVETSIPAATLFILVNGYGSPVVVLNSPLPNLFFMFILLSVLRMEFGLSLFTGLVAGIEFLIIGWIYNPNTAFQNDFDYAFFYSKIPIVMRSLMFIASGIIAGLVGIRLRNTLRNSYKILEERNQIVGMFGQYVSPSVVDRLMSQKTEGISESREVCVMFLDIRNFTKFSEKKSPTEVITYLNTLFEDMIDIVNKNNGIINKFLGDGFMAVFGAPLSDPGKDVQNAVKASLEIIEKVAELNLAQRIPETKIGIGLHSGEAMTGNVGSSQRKEYTIIGDTVNLASRVEQLNKDYGTELLVTDSVYEQIKHYMQAESLPPVKVKGREEEVLIYRLT